MLCWELQWHGGQSSLMHWAPVFVGGHDPHICVAGGAGGGAGGGRAGPCWPAFATLPGAGALLRPATLDEARLAAAATAAGRAPLGAALARRACAACVRSHGLHALVGLMHAEVAKRLRQQGGTLPAHQQGHSNDEKTFLMADYLSKFMQIAALWKEGGRGADPATASTASDSSGDQGREMDPVNEGSQGLGELTLGLCGDALPEILAEILAQPADISSEVRELLPVSAIQG
jgi:hypothetical protein